MAAALLCLSQLGGCADPPACPTRDYPTPQAAAEAATFVVGTVVTSRDTDTTLFGVPAHRHRIRTTGLAAIKSDDVGYEDQLIVSTPSCEPDNPYPTGDPLLAAGNSTVTLFLVFDRTDRTFRTHSPSAAVIPYATTGELPATWP